MDSQGPAVVRDHAGWTPTSAAVPPPMIEPVVALRGPYLFSFGYAGPDKVFQPNWQNRAELPRQIRISVRDARSLQSLAVSTVALVHIDTPSECARAKVLAQCPLPVNAGRLNGSAKEEQL